MSLSFVRLAVLALCLIGWLVVPVGAETTAEQREAFQALRSAIAGRKLAEFAPALEKLKSLKGDAAFETEVNRLELLTQYVKGFWESVDRGAAAALKSGEMQVDGVPVAIVDYDRKLFVIRSAGQNKRYSIGELPAKLALVLAQLEMKKEVANNKVYFGAFLAMDAKGDRRLAREQWDEAARGGVDVKFLLPELETTQVAPSIELPELTAQNKALLNPAQWLLRKREKTRISRDAIGKLGKQNDDGRLEIGAAKGAESQALFKHAAKGDFRCIAFFAGLSANRKFGLYGATNEQVVEISLPAGDVKVELRRTEGKLTAKVNELAVVIPDAEATAKFAGNIGVTLAEDAPTVIAGFFVEGR